MSQIINGIAYLTEEVAAERLGVKYGTVRNWVSKGIIPAEETVKVGKFRLISVDYIKDMEGRAVLKKMYRRR